MSAARLSIIIPAYNEAEAIGPTLRKLSGMTFPIEHEIIIVDDGSTDDTYKVCSEFPVILLKHSVNKGYGAALKTGIRKSSGDRIIILDSDGQHDPDEISKFIDLLEEYDMVIGERSAESFQVANRKLGKRIIRKVGEYLVEQKLPDFNSGFRAFRKDLILELLHMMPNGFSFSTTSTLAFLKEGYNIATLPINVKERVGRKSNVKFFKDGSKTMLLLFRIIMLFNPLKVFFPASIAISFFGLAFGVYGYIEFDKFSNTGVLMITLGMFLFFIGLLADQISILNRKKF